MEYIKNKMVIIMSEEEQSLLEKGVLNKIESRLNNLETSVNTILAKGDEFNEVTQEKLEKIQIQLEKQSQSMRKLKRKLMDRYNPYVIVGILLLLVCLWILFMLSLIHI